MNRTKRNRDDDNDDDDVNDNSKQHNHNVDDSVNEGKVDTTTTTSNDLSNTTTGGLKHNSFSHIDDSVAGVPVTIGHNAALNNSIALHRLQMIQRQERMVQQQQQQQQQQSMVAAAIAANEARSRNLTSAPLMSHYSNVASRLSRPGSTSSSLSTGIDLPRHQLHPPTQLRRGHSSDEALINDLILRYNSVTNDPTTNVAASLLSERHFGALQLQEQMMLLQQQQQLNRNLTSGLQGNTGVNSNVQAQPQLVYNEKLRIQATMNAMQNNQLNASHNSNLPTSIHHLPRMNSTAIESQLQHQQLLELAARQQQQQQQRERSLLTTLNNAHFRNTTIPSSQISSLPFDDATRPNILSQLAANTGSRIGRGQPTIQNDNTNETELQRNISSESSVARLNPTDQQQQQQQQLSKQKPSRLDPNVKTKIKKKVIPLSEQNFQPENMKELSLPSDSENLSEYQCILRQQIVLFSVSLPDIQCSAQGRNKPITIGQVGVLCRHCANITPGMRPCGAVYFPAKLSGLYQASQNMAINHFSRSCQSIPEPIRTKLFELKERKSTVLGGGKHFWANGARVIGVIECDDQLRYTKVEDEAVEDEGKEEMKSD